MRKTFFLLWLILLLITKSYNIYSQNFWEATNGPHRNVWSLAINSSDHIFVGTNAGIYRSIDNGESWTEINSGLDTTYAIKALAINSNNHIFAGTYRNVFRSTDNGESWTKINTGLATYIDVYSIKINSSNHIFIGTLYDSPYGGGRIYRSTDNGENWTQLSNSPSDVYSLVINLNDNIFAGTVNGVFRSTDNGNNWSQINNGLTIPYVQSLTINSSDYIFAGAYNNLGGKVFRSTDSGENWIDITNGLPSQPIECFVINTSDQIFLSPLGAGIFISVNDGNNWSQINNGLTEPWVKALAINSEGYIFAGTFNSSNVNNGIVFKSIEPVDSVTTKTPVIFVPGIMGSPLYQDENNDNHLLPKEKAWVEKSLSGFLNLFYLPLAENGIDPEDEDANIKVAPLRNDPPITLREEFNHQPMDVYKNFFGNLESQGYILDNYDDNHTQG